MQGRDQDAATVLAWAVSEGADLDALRANLRLTPVERMQELVAMNQFHHDVQMRTLSPTLRAELERREVELARQRLKEMGE